MTAGSERPTASTPGCPTWCTTTPAEHAEDDPRRLAHDGPEIAAGFSAAQMGGEAPVAYFHEREGLMSTAELRELAAEAIKAAQWLEGSAARSSAS